jgi:peroxiredoxin (alkyl hydroperoxide reductase subunit C)
MTISVGSRVPDIMIKRMGSSGPEGIKTNEIFTGEKVILFGVPGAFTPTCSQKHLPGFVNYADDIKAKGVTTIACMSVNDAYVMDAWGKDLQVNAAFEMLADGNAELTKALGLEVDLTARGFGIRCRRFAMVVENGVVTMLNVEESGEFDISSAESVLAAL